MYIIVSDYCAASSCLNGTTCVDGINGYSCKCPDRIYWIECQDVDDCAKSVDPCQNGGPVLMVTIPTLAAALETIEDQHVRSVNIITVRNVVAERLCFHRRLSFCSQGGVYPSMHWARHPPTPRRPLQQMVRILLECILVQYNFLKVVYESGVKG